MQGPRTRKTQLEDKYQDIILSSLQRENISGNLLSISKEHQPVSLEHPLGNVPQNCEGSKSFTVDRIILRSFPLLQVTHCDTKKYKVSQACHL